MKKTFSAVAIATILFASSCKKDDKDDVSIVGKWTISEIGADNNDNNKVDAGETAPASAIGLTGFLDLKSNSTF